MGPWVGIPILTQPDRIGILSHVLQAGCKRRGGGEIVGGGLGC